MNKLFTRAGLLASALSPLSAFAQSTGSGAVDPTAIVAAINANVASVTAVGAAVLAIVVSIVAFKWVKRAL